MIESVAISLIVGLAALHVALRLLPKRVQQKLRGAMAAGLNKIGLHATAKRFIAIPQATGKACGSGCDACGTQPVPSDELKLNGSAKVVQFHPRLR
jgi:hypothetical protein